MTWVRRALAVAVLAAAVFAPLPAAAGLPDLTDDAIAGFEAADTGAEGPHAYAYMAAAIGHRHGWADPRVATYLAKLYSLRNPDGGWGLNAAWDAFQDGTTNPATTTYTVTLADHVGPVLLEAYTHGLVPAADVQAVVNLLMTTHSTTYTTSGRCVAYSRSGFDNAVTTGCVHNVNSAAAWFLLEARDAGFDAPGLATKVAEMVRMEAGAWKWQTQWWPYIGTGGPADTDHTAAQAWQTWRLARPLGEATARRILTDFAAYDDNASAPLAVVRLATLSPEMAALAQPWMGEVEDLVTDPPSARVLAQVAYWASQVA
jgi:hypothetical protein